MKLATRLHACERGVTAVEFALLAPAFLGMTIGIIYLGLVLWTSGSLYYAVQIAARCASVDSINCATGSAVTTYALSQYYGQSLGGTNPFTYSATGCGHTVSASYTYSLLIPFYGSYSFPLSAQACFP